MNELLAVLGLSGPLSLIVALLVIGLLSQRLGTITRQTRAYRWLFLVVGLVATAIIRRLLTIDSVDDPIYPLLIAFALTIGAAVAWQYWGWLLHERQHQPHATTSGQVHERAPQ